MNDYVNYFYVAALLMIASSSRTRGNRNKRFFLDLCLGQGLSNGSSQARGLFQPFSWKFQWIVGLFDADWG